MHALQAFLRYQKFKHLFPSSRFGPSRITRCVDILTFQYGPPCSLERLCEEKRSTH